MKNMRWLVFILIAVTLLSACGGGSQTSSSSGTVDSKGHVNLEFWYALGGDAGKAVEQLVKSFNESQTNITVTATYQGDYTTAMAKIYSAIAGNSLPSMAQVGGAPLLGSSDVLIPIPDFLAADTSFDLNSIQPAFIEYNKAGGTLWSLPFNNSVPVLYYNKDLFKAAGLDPEAPPATLDELLIDAQKLTIEDNNTGTPSQWGLNTKEDTHWYLSTMILENGGKIVNETETEVLYNQPKAVEMLQLWGDWVNKYKVMPPNQHAEAQSDFLAGKLGMLIGSSSQVYTLTSSASFDLGVGVFPAVGTNLREIPIGGGSLIIFKNADKRISDAAWEFSKFMISQDSSIYLTTQTGYLPIYADAFNWPEIQALISQTPQRKASIESLPYAVSIPVFAALGNSDLALRNAVQKVELSAATPQKALDDAKISVDASIVEFTNP
jgi:ABC-type glycerol-3-phosphate transport system substrate-binding protein